MGTAGKMDILILGGTGSLGHKLFQVLRRQFPETYCTIRGAVTDRPLRQVELFQNGKVIENFDATDFPAVEKLLLEIKPRVLINCIGVIKQRPQTSDMVASLTANSLLPHKLSEFCDRWEGKLIHFSTDCVFSGKRGEYREEDFSDAEDIYGRTKYLGEVRGSSAITLRTSFIGRELMHRSSLLEWFLGSNHGRVNGYTNALFSGATNIWLADVVADLIQNHLNLSGVYQVTGQTISKFELLSLIRDAFKLDIVILPDPSFRCDRSMVGEKFERATGHSCPPWPDLIDQLASDTTPYEKWRELER